MAPLYPPILTLSIGQHPPLPPLLEKRSEADPKIAIPVIVALIGAWLAAALLFAVYYWMRRRQQVECFADETWPELSHMRTTRHFFPRSPRFGSINSRSSTTTDWIFKLFHSGRNVQRKHNHSTDSRSWQNASSASQQAARGPLTRLESTHAVYGGDSLQETAAAYLSGERDWTIPEEAQRDRAMYAADFFFKDKSWSDRLAPPWPSSRRVISSRFVPALESSDTFKEVFVPSTPKTTRSQRKEKTSSRDADQHAIDTLHPSAAFNPQIRPSRRIPVYPSNPSPTPYLPTIREQHYRIDQPRDRSRSGGTITIGIASNEVQRQPELHRVDSDLDSACSIDESHTSLGWVDRSFVTLPATAYVP